MNASAAVPRTLAPRARTPHEPALTILLHAAEPAATAAADALRNRLSATVEVAATTGDCRRALGRQTVSVLLLEESLSTVASDDFDALLSIAGPALVMEINFALTSADRLVRQLQAALQRRAHDELVARHAARQVLQQELSGALTGLLLESQLALRQAEPGFKPALERLVGLAEHLCSQLQD